VLFVARMRMQMGYSFQIGLLYHGLNVLILDMDLRAFQSGDPRWVTYQQAQNKDSQVRKGEHSTAIFFTKSLLKSKTTSKTTVGK
jgi:antirestriction protein ArdC